MKKGILLLLTLSVLSVQSEIIMAQGTSTRDIHPMSIKSIDPIICYSRDENMHTYVPIRAKLEAMSAARLDETEAAVFEVNFTGFNNDQKAAFLYATEIWGSLISSEIPIRIDVSMANLGAGALAGARAETYYRNFNNAQKINTWYVVALAEKMMGQELNGPENPDIIMTYNSAQKYYTGLDGNPPEDFFDLVTISLHEIAHGLGFTSLSTVDDDGIGDFVFVFPHVYDRALENADFENISDTYTNPSVALGDQFTNNELYFNEASFTTGSLPRLYAPFQWDGGSSIAHLNENTYPAGDDNSLMTPQVGLSEAIHDPGLSLTILQDMGWISMGIDHDALLDTEDASSARAITAIVKGDNALASNAVNLIYTFTNFTAADTIEMVASGNPDEFVALIPATGGDAIVSYYITVDDAAGRKFTSPGEAPEFYNQYEVGPDTENPELFHQPLSVVFENDPIADISAIVGDNLGVNPLMMTYRVNSGATSEIEVPILQFEQDGYYVAEHLLEWDLGALGVVKGDVVEYKLKVTDKSSSANEAIHPSEDIGFNQIQIDALNDPAEFYLNDFNTETSDFIGTGFKIGAQSGFSNGLIYTDHPYRTSPGISADDTLILDYVLKTPIIVSEFTDNINFDEVVLVEPGEPGNNFGDSQFWDYVVVEASKDLGVTWIRLADGYDSGDDPVWLEHYNSDLVMQEFQGSTFPNSEAEGNESLMRGREISILESGSFQPGDEILIRFKLYADQLAAGWGWAIDNLKIQIDDEKPVIVHNPTDYLSIGDTNFKINTRVTDNGTLDSVTFEINIDGTTEFIGADAETELYELNVSLNAITATSDIKYRIIAVDSASIPNTAYLPELGFFEIPVANLGEAKSVYNNDFSSAVDDFIGVNFSVREEEGFSTPGIHSKHPHSNAPVNQDTMSFLLKYPIKTNSDHSWMRFDEVALVDVNGDGVVVEVSGNNGADWYPVMDKYGALEYSEWVSAYSEIDINGNSIGVGSEGLMRSRLIDLLSPSEINGGDEILVRFSMLVDTIGTAWGWAIDNVEIQDVTTGIADVDLSNIKLYPNPAVNGRFRVAGKLDSNKAILTISDITGKILLTDEVQAIDGSFDKEYNLQEAKPGILFVSFKTATSVSTSRLILR